MVKSIFLYAWLLLSIFCVPIMGQNPPKYHVGFIDPNGEVVIEPIFDSVNNSWWDWPQGFSEGLAVVGKDNKLGYIDKTGQFVIAPRFDRAAPFSEGLARVMIKDPNGNEYTRYINKNGEYAFDKKFRDSSNFQDGLARVSIPRRIKGQLKYMAALIDKIGRIVSELPYEYRDVGGFAEGLGVLYDKNTTKVNAYCGFIDTSGKIVIPLQYSDTLGFIEGLALVAITTPDDDYRWGFIDKTGHYVIPPILIEAYPFAEGLAYVAYEESRYFDDGKRGFIDRQGKLVIDCSKIGIFILKFSDGIASFRESIMKGSKYGFINKKGEIAIEPIYDSAGYFSHGRADVSLNGKNYVIDKKGKIVFEHDYFGIDFFYEGLARIMVRIEGGQVKY